MILSGADLLKTLRVSGHNLGLWEFNLSTETFNFDPEACEILSLPENSQSISSSSFFKIFDFDKSSNLSQHIMGLLKCDKQFSITLPTKKINNEFKWIKLTGQSFRKEIPLRIGGVIEDVSTQHSREEAYLENNFELSLFERCLEQFTIVARTDARGRITFANEEFCRLSKYTSDELIGRDHRILNSGHHSAEFFRQIWSKILSGKNWRGEIKNKAKDGTYYWVDTIISPVMTIDGNLKEILSFRFDITRLKLLELENLKLKENQPSPSLAEQT